MGKSYLFILSTTEQALIKFHNGIYAKIYVNLMLVFFGPL
jgi:hypothetical protein